MNGWFPINAIGARSKYQLDATGCDDNDARSTRIFERRRTGVERRETGLARMDVFKTNNFNTKNVWSRKEKLVFEKRIRPVEKSL